MAGRVPARGGLQRAVAVDLDAGLPQFGDDRLDLGSGAVGGDRRAIAGERPGVHVPHARPGGEPVGGEPNVVARAYRGADMRCVKGLIRAKPDVAVGPEDLRLTEFWCQLLGQLRHRAQDLVLVDRLVFRPVRLRVIRLEALVELQRLFWPPAERHFPMLSGVRGCTLGLAGLTPGLCPMLVARGEYEIDDDPARLDLDVVHGFIAGSYWAAGAPRDVVARSVANSLNLGLRRGGNQVGFTRAVTDRATFARVRDVFVLPGHRGRGPGHWMIETLRARPGLAALRRSVPPGCRPPGRRAPSDHERAGPLQWKRSRPTTTAHCRCHAHVRRDGRPDHHGGTAPPGEREVDARRPGRHR